MWECQKQHLCGLDERQYYHSSFCKFYKTSICSFVSANTSALVEWGLLIAWIMDAVVLIRWELVNEWKEQAFITREGQMAGIPFDRVLSTDLSIPFVFSSMIIVTCDVWDPCHFHKSGNWTCNYSWKIWTIFSQSSSSLWCILFQSR